MHLEAPDCLAGPLQQDKGFFLHIGFEANEEHTSRRIFSFRNSRSLLKATISYWIVLPVKLLVLLAATRWLCDRETDLLYAVNHSSLQNERRIALVIAHEMAHLVSQSSSNMSHCYSCSLLKAHNSWQKLSFQGEIFTISIWNLCNARSNLSLCLRKRVNCKAKDAKRKVELATIISFDKI